MGASVFGPVFDGLILAKKVAVFTKISFRPTKTSEDEKKGVVETVSSFVNAIEDESRCYTSNKLVRVESSTAVAQASIP